MSVAGVSLGVRSLDFTLLPPRERVRRVRTAVYPITSVATMKPIQRKASWAWSSEHVSSNTLRSTSVAEVSLPSLMILRVGTYEESAVDVLEFRQVNKSSRCLHTERSISVN